MEKELSEQKNDLIYSSRMKIYMMLLEDSSRLIDHITKTGKHEINMNASFFPVY